MLDEDDDVFVGAQVDPGGDGAEDGVDVGAGDGGGGEEDVEVIGATGGVGQLLDLDESAEAADDGEAQYGDLRAGEDPEHVVAELGSVLRKNQNKNCN